MILILAKHTDQNNMMTKWLLTVTLLISIFSFSGYSDHYPSRLQNTTKTELVTSNHHKLGKRTASINKVVENIRFHGPFYRYYNSLEYQLFSYNILTKVKLDNIKKQYYPYKSANLYLHIKKHTPSSDEDIFLPFLG